MSSNLYKQNRVIINSSEEPRVIDSNDFIAARIQKLTEILEMEAEPDFSGDFVDGYSDGFSEGLMAEQVDALLEDPTSAEQQITNASEQAKAIVEQAYADASAVIESANSEAAGVLESAEQEAARIKEASKASGYDEGYNQGREEGLKYYEQMQNELAQQEAQRVNDYNAKLESMESDLVETLTSIYEHVLSVSLSDMSEVIFKLLDNTIHSIEGGKNYLVHVSKDDYEYVLEHKDELKKGLGSSDTVEIIEDMTLSESQCYIEADTGIYDCGLDTQLKALSKELRLLSYQPS